MAIQVHLTTEDEARLRERAATRGESPEKLAGELLHGLLQPPVNGPPGGLLPVVDEHGVFHQERWDVVMASIARGSVNAPVLPAEALTREGLYQDHD